MVYLEYLPYYWKLSNHIWQLYTLDVEKFSICLNLTFDLYQGHMIKKTFFGGGGGGGVHLPVIAAQQNLLIAAAYNLYTCSYYQKCELVTFWN